MTETQTKQKTQIPEVKLKVKGGKVAYFSIPHHLDRFTQTPAQIVVFIALMEVNSFKDGEIYSSYKYLGDLTHLNEKTIQRTLPELEELGLIEITPRQGRTNLITILLEGKTYLKPRTKCPNTPDKMSEVPRTKCPTSNKELSNKELYKEPDITKKLTERENAQRLAQQEQEFLYPKRQQQFPKSWEAPPLRKVKDTDIELIPLARLGGKFKKDTRTVLPGQGGIKKK